MIPTVVGILTIAVGVLLVYAGVHGVPGLLDVQAPSTFLPQAPQ